MSQLEVVEMEDKKQKQQQQREEAEAEAEEEAPVVPSSLRATATCRSLSSLSSSLRWDHRGDDDEEEAELRWAAIERLPTLDRMRTSVLSSEAVDVRRLGAAQRRVLVERLVADIQRDNLRLLRKQRRRMERVGVRQPTVEVRWRNVRVEADCQVVSGKPLPTLLNTVLATARGLSRRPHARIPILNDVTGILKPSRYY
jgi:ribosomal protein L24